MKQTLLRQAKLIRIQWAVILALLVALIVTAFCKTPVAAMGTDDAPTQSSFEPIVAAAMPTTEPEPTPAFVSLGEFKLTAYCPCEKCCGKLEESPYYGITAYGYIATAGRTIAVDPRVIPIGSEVVINGHTYVAEDVGGAIKENRIDIYFNTHQEALEFGVQYAEVFINQ